MPIYEYECENCGVRFERLQRMADAALTDCPECGGHVHRVMQPVGVIFKGSGFYVTDNRGKSSTGIPAKKKDDEGGKEEGGKPATSAPSESAAPAVGNTPAGGASTSSASSGAAKESKAA
jgi:putative FmdB family regulatory protein